MKKVVLLSFFVSAISFAAAHPEKNYVCTKGDQRIKYLITYKSDDVKVPCKVFEKYPGQTKYKQIAFSEKTIDVCEAALQKTLARCKSQGMLCEEKNDRK